MLTDSSALLPPAELPPPDFFEPLLLPLENWELASDAQLGEPEEPPPVTGLPDLRALAIHFLISDLELIDEIEL